MFEKEFRPVQELIIYQQENAQNFYMQTAPLFSSDTGVKRGAFSELSQEAIAHLVGTFTASCSQYYAGIIPHNVLAFNPYKKKIVWWTEATRTMLAMTDELKKEMGLFGKSYTYPASVFYYNQGELYVYALAQNKRPCNV